MELGELSEPPYTHTASVGLAQARPNRGFPKPRPLQYIFSQHLELPTIVGTLWLQTDLQISVLNHVSFAGYAGFKFETFLYI